MKDKRIKLIAGAMVALCTVLLFTAVFSAQEVSAQQPLAVPAEEESAPAVTPAPQPQPVMAESENMDLPIGAPPLPQKELTPEEVLFPNWVEAEPGAADITDEQAVENATLVVKTLFGIEQPTVKDVRFYKDMTGQRSSEWYIAFAEENLMVSVNALTGNIFFADADKLFEQGEDYYYPLPSAEEEYDPEQDEYKKLIDEIMAEIESGDSEYLTATFELVQDYLPGGGIKRTEIAAIHGDGRRHPAVGIAVEVEDGTGYRPEWVKDGETGELLLYRLYVYPTWEHLMAGETHHADMLYWEYYWSIEENREVPAVEPTPALEPAIVPSMTMRGIADAATAAIGSKYETGAGGPDKFDSSGLIYHCLKEAGMEVQRQTCAVYAELEGNVRIEDMDRLAIGDVLFFRGDSGEGSINHAGVYIDDMCMAHASSSNGEVVATILHSNYWQKTFSHALRFK